MKEREAMDNKLKEFRDEEESNEREEKEVEEKYEENKRELAAKNGWLQSYAEETAKRWCCKRREKTKHCCGKCKKRRLQGTSKG